MNKPQPKSSHPYTAPQGAFTQLILELQQAVSDRGYHTPTPIQEKVIKPLLNGRDLIGCAQTGTGKTAAFILPILQYLTKNSRPRVRNKNRVLVLAPTRELAAQIGDSIKNYGRYLKISHTVIFGGVGQNPQVRALVRGVDIVTATPGRLLDLINQRHINLDNTEILVLDEADRMLDMGFIYDVQKIISKLPKKRQTLFFSATMDPEVIKLSEEIVNDAVFVKITPDKPAVERIIQKVFFVDKNRKDALLTQLLRAKHLSRVLVFVQMKHSADKVVRQLHSSSISAVAIHGNKSQTARTAALAKFKLGQIRVLVATDIAARGIDVDSISHVINYDLPNTPNTYVHRIGRTARAGAEGDAVSFCSAPDRDCLRAIEKMLHMKISVDRDSSFHSQTAEFATGAAARPLPRGRGSSRSLSSAAKREKRPNPARWQKTKSSSRNTTYRRRYK